jgi:hypothetical protein
MELEHLGRSDGGAVSAAEGRTPLACEYAKYKYRLHDFTVRVCCACEGLLDAQVPTIGVLEIGVPEMTDDPSPSVPERKPLTPAARRALAEAEARRQAAEANAQPVARELQGPKGPEPTRYGDWENKGIASDF